MAFDISITSLFIYELNINDLRNDNEWMNNSLYLTMLSIGGPLLGLPNFYIIPYMNNI